MRGIFLLPWKSRLREREREKDSSWNIREWKKGKGDAGKKVEEEEETSRRIYQSFFVRGLIGIYCWSEVMCTRER